MGFRIGNRVKIKAVEYAAYIDKKMKDPNFLALIEMMQRMEEAGKGGEGGAPTVQQVIDQRTQLLDRLSQEAVITGLPLGGSYANLKFDNDFECGMPIEYVEKI